MTQVKPLFWIGSSKKDLRALPEEVQDVFGYALYLARVGKKHAVFVLHVFKKKSIKGIKSPQHDLELIRERFRTAAGKAKELAL